MSARPNVIRINYSVFPFTSDVCTFDRGAVFLRFISKHRSKTAKINYTGNCVLLIINNGVRVHIFTEGQSGLRTWEPRGQLDSLKASGHRAPGNFEPWMWAGSEIRQIDWRPAGPAAVLDWRPTEKPEGPDFCVKYQNWIKIKHHLSAKTCLKT